MIIGGGVGGGTAAIYLGRAGFHPIVIERSTPGGAIVQSDAVENWPGCVKDPGNRIDGAYSQQAEYNGAIFFNEEVVSVDFSKRPFTITTRSLDNPKTIKNDSSEHSASLRRVLRRIIFIFLAKANIGGKAFPIARFATAIFTRDKRVGIVGGGDAAILEALYLSKIAKEVTVFVRKDQFKGVETKRKEALLSLPNVKVLYQTILQEIKGNGQHMTEVVVAPTKSPKRAIELDGLFLAIGSQPNTCLI